MGGVAAAVSKTAAAPIERVKLLMFEYSPASQNDDTDRIVARIKMK